MTFNMIFVDVNSIGCMNNNMGDKGQRADLSLV